MGGLARQGLGQTHPVSCLPARAPQSHAPVFQRRSPAALGPWPHFIVAASGRHPLTCPGEDGAPLCVRHPLLPRPSTSRAPPGSSLATDLEAAPLRGAGSRPAAPAPAREPVHTQAASLPPHPGHPLDGLASPKPLAPPQAQRPGADAREGWRTCGRTVGFLAPRAGGAQGWGCGGRDPRVSPERFQKEQ